MGVDARARPRVFPPAPGLPHDREAYLRFVDDIYQSDAYHSLSIEGYSVSAELIERVRAGNWDPDHHDDDRQSRDALAARGYWQAFQIVKANVARDHRRRQSRPPGPHRSPRLVPRIVPALRGGGPDCARAHSPATATTRSICARRATCRRAGKPCAMPCPRSSICWNTKPEPGVRAVLGHWLFGYIHPYPDGNGRMARFLMNAMLASGGYPWTVIRVEDRDAYLAALDRASIDMDIEPFAELHRGARPVVDAAGRVSLNTVS